MAKRNVKTNRDRFNRQKATWDPSEDKSQMSLAQGSSEYKAYTEDLANNDPSKVDDEFHAELEESNVDAREEMFEDTAESIDEGVERRKYRMQQMKRGMIPGIAKAARKAARMTPDKADDRKAAKIRLDREPAIRTIYDDGVPADKEDVDDQFTDGEFLPKWMDKYI